MRKLLLTCTACILALAGIAQENALWLRYPAISPDGRTIAFGYKGDIYKVDAGGGVAVPLTIHEAHDMMPVWSHDGKHIAFASDRYGNFDVYVMPAAGGTPVRLTANSAPDYPYDFSPDNSKVLFGSARNAPAASIRFSTSLFDNLYTVPVKGGRPLLLSAAGAEYARFNRNGDQVVFQDRKGYEDPLRKHHVSAVTRDIWVFNIKNGTYQRISGYEGEDREPVFGNNDEVYYLSEKGGGSQNLFKTTVSGKEQLQQLTRFDKHPVRHLSRSENNLLCFTYNGEIYTLKEGSQPKKVAVQIFNDGRAAAEKRLPINGNVTEFAMSPNGKEMAFVARGEVYVTSAEGNMTKRITNTPQQERMIEWSPDGKRLVYAAERNGNWDIYQTTVVRKEEPYFYGATLLKEEPLLATSEEEYQPQFSPDGKELGYVADRNILKVLNVASGKTRTILPKGRNHSYADGDWSFSWSPDSKWLVVDDQQGFIFSQNAVILPADGKGPGIYPVNSGFGEGNPKWVADGKILTWESSREGRKSLARQGSRESDIYAVFFDQETFDNYILSKDDFTLLKETEENARKDSSNAAKNKTKDSTDKKKVFKPDFDNLENRQKRLTISSASIGDYVLNKDASKLYYMAAFEKGYDLWETEPRTGETKILAKLGGTPGNIALSKDGNTLFVSNRGNVVKVNTGNGKVTPITISSEMTLNQGEERRYILDHAWKQVKEKFYDPKLHGIDWKMYHDNYARFLPHVSNNYDFQELLSEMLGELNASHTGGRYISGRPDGDNTAVLGLLYDETFTKDGLKVDEVIAGGPFDKASSKLRKGHIIESIDGEKITADADWAILLNRKAGKNVLIGIYDPATNTRWDEAVKPIDGWHESEVLMYKRWANNMRKMVDKLSNGKVGYVHVEGMNDASFRSVYDEVMGKNRAKEALIVDTRFNGGGWLHDDLNNFLSGKKYLEFAPQGEKVRGGEPQSQWQGPSCVVMSEGNYSDAFIFPYVYKQAGIGKLIGMPVPGTGTAVWWERQIDRTLIFGIPMIATMGKEGRPTENMQVEPDIRVPLRYEEFLAGKDAQIEAAVNEMLKAIR